jgi:hypothetical protein
MVGDINKNPQNKGSIKAPAPGSYEETKELVCDAILNKMGSGYDVWLKATYPDKVVARVYPYGNTNPLADSSPKFYEVPYSIDANGVVTLDDAKEVKLEENYVEVTQKMRDSTIVRKDDVKRLITAPVLIPYCDDCDAKRGEKQLSPEEIEFMSHEFMSKHRIVDKMHDYFKTQENVADIVESWQLREAQKFENIFGEDKEYPEGTWMATTKITDDDTWDKCEKGIYTGYSVSALSKELADSLVSKADELGIAEKDRVLIKDLTNPVGYTISLVPEPCVDAKFLSLKGDMMAKDEKKVDKAGAMFSGANLGMLQKAYEAIGNLLNKQNKVEEKKTKDENLEASKSEVLDMEEKDVRAMVDESVGKMKDELIKELKPVEKKDEPEKLTDEKIATLKEDSEKGNLESYKQLVEAGVDVEGLTINVEKMDAFKSMKENVDNLNEKLGIDPAKKSMEGQDKDKDKSVKKSDSDFYKEAGLKSNGKPLDK